MIGEVTRGIARSVMLDEAALKLLNGIQDEIWGVETFGENLPMKRDILLRY